MLRVPRCGAVAEHLLPQLGPRVGADDAAVLDAELGSRRNRTQSS